MRFTVILEPETDGRYSVHCPALPGCISQGDNRKEALANIKEAILGVLEVRRKHHLPQVEETVELVAEEVRQIRADRAEEGLPLTLKTVVVEAPAEVATHLDQPWQLALDELTAELRALYGERLKAVILYGSRARGDADAESDIDVLVVLEPLGDFWQELSAIERITCPLSLKHGLVLSAFPAALHEYQCESSSFIANVRREGIIVNTLKVE